MLRGGRFLEKKLLEGQFNVIGVTRGWAGFKFPGKTRYITLEWPLIGELNIILSCLALTFLLRVRRYNVKLWHYETAVPYAVTRCSEYQQPRCKNDDFMKRVNFF